MFPLAIALASTLLASAAGNSSLRELASAHRIRFGAAVNPSLLDQKEYADVLAREFNQVEPENAMKFGPVQPGPDTFHFGPADLLVRFAEQHRMAIRGHTMVWHRQVPAWVMEEKDPARLSAILHSHIQAVMGRYAGKVYAWDVVNEAFVDDGTLRHTVWSDSPGIGLAGTHYVEQAFRWAHEADPQALLFYNDYDAEGMNAKSAAIYKMASDFVRRGVPLNGIGLQMHLTLHPPPLEAMKANIQRIAGLGLQLQITELDVRVPVDSDGHESPANLSEQSRIYGDVVSLCLQNPRCSAVQVWGVTDKYSWIPHEFHNLGAALPFDDRYQPKPACTAIERAFQDAPAR